jgi:hypothetical protein
MSHWSLTDKGHFQRTVGRELHPAGPSKPRTQVGTSSCPKEFSYVLSPTLGLPKGVRALTLCGPSTLSLLPRRAQTPRGPPWTLTPGALVTLWKVNCCPLTVVTPTVKTLTKQQISTLQTRAGGGGCLR